MKVTSQVLAPSYPIPYSRTFAIKHIPHKRIFDVVFSLLALVFLFPLCLIIMIAIRLTSRGKALYAQERIGRRGKVFKCYKFRSMYQDADKRLESLLKDDSALQEEWRRSFKLKNDPRITFIGQLLRKTSLDEIPQFWNVFKGDLSVVGPRPVVKEEINLQYGPKAPKILSIRPGITGLWQVSGRSNTSYKARIKLDEFYVDNQTFLFDLKLILKTIPCMIRTKGAY